MRATAPEYTLACRTSAGEEVRLVYRPHASELVDGEGVALLADAAPRVFEPAPRVSPSAPGRKTREVRTLKIQLGLRCNLACSYCNQASAVPDHLATRTADAQDFLDKLDLWLEGAPQRIEFWGGEPLLYLAKLRRLVPALRERFPDAAFAMVSNGSLVDGEVIDFLEAWDVGVAISHDGPGQHLRGPDPFEDPVRAHWLRELCRRRGREAGRVHFHVVLTPANADLAATRAWFVERLGDPEVAVDAEGVVGVYDEQALPSATWSEEDYRRLHEGIVHAFETGDILHWRSLREKAQDFVHSLRGHRPGHALGQKCGMDAEDQIAVDLQGNVLTCQNTAARGRHRIGNVDHMEAVRLDTATHWSHRECCTHCPVVQLCRGGCMFLEGLSFARTCENEYRFNLAVLAGVLRSVTGLRLESIAGDVRRPAPRRTILLAQALA